MRTKRKIFGVTLIIVIVLIPAIYFTFLDSREIDKLHEEYRKIERRDIINNQIKEIKTLKGASFLTFENGKKIFIPTSGNYLYNKEYLDQNLLKGTSIRKNIGSDTIIVLTENQNLYFVIGKFLKN
jgi:hypothetical protein